MGSVQTDAIFNAVAESLVDVEDLCKMLEITVEDIIERFEDRILECRDKFAFPETVAGVYPDELSPALEQEFNDAGFEIVQGAQVEQRRTPWSDDDA